MMGRWLEGSPMMRRILLVCLTLLTILMTGCGTMTELFDQKTFPEQKGLSEAEQQTAIEAALAEKYNEPFTLISSTRMQRDKDYTMYYAAQAHSQSCPEVTFSLVFEESDGRISQCDYIKKLAEHKMHGVILNTVETAYGTAIPCALDVMPSASLTSQDILSDSFPAGFEKELHILLTLFFAPDGFDPDGEAQSLEHVARSFRMYEALTMNAFYFNGALKAEFVQNPDAFVSFERTFHAGTALNKGDLLAFFSYNGSPETLLEGPIRSHFTVKEGL